jgi:hypothetical protein
MVSIVAIVRKGENLVQGWAEFGLQMQFDIFIASITGPIAQRLVNEQQFRYVIRNI